MSEWYEITPLDTLFFRGSEPLEAGQLTAEALFPPPVSVIQGALRTTVLRQREIPFADYGKHGEPEEITALIGASGNPAPFAITAILLQKNGKLYAPAPWAWFVDVSEKADRGAEYAGREVLVVGRPDPVAVEKLGLVASSGSLPFVLAQHEAVSLGGSWVRMDALCKRPQKLGEGDVLMPRELYMTESRTGIGLDTTKRTVNKGQLYSAGHIRLAEGVRLVIGIDRGLGLAPSGVIQLGGERRMSGYRKIDPVTVPTTDA
nr:type III-B CRISPR module-associated Cmr3 family protein [Spirochaetota bacterium]